MFCPDCGTAEQKADTYCKRCGKYLRDPSLRGRLLGGNNPQKAAGSIAGFSIFSAVICLLISYLILSAEKSGDLSKLKYAFILCWAITGYLVALSVMCIRLLRKIKSAQTRQDMVESGRASSAIDSSGEATTVPLNSTRVAPRGREEEQVPWK